MFLGCRIAQKYNCSLVRLDYQQEQGLMSSLPLGASHIQIERSLTTSSVGRVRPFCDAGAFRAATPCLRDQRQDRQHDYARPQTGEMSERAKAGDTGKRQKYEL